MYDGVNTNIILAKIQQLSWWARYLRDLAHQDNCCENHQFNSGIYSSLSCDVFGPINIDDEPVSAQTIPQSPWCKGLAGSHHQIFQKQRTQRLDRWLIQGSEGRYTKNSACLMAPDLAVKRQRIA